jgi:lysyl-tRNA synthetase class 2
MVHPIHSSDWKPTAGWPALRKRAELARRARAFFDDRGFLEVETPLVSADSIVDLHLEPFAVEGGLWLQTSPEFGMKRLMAAGAEAIYQITRAFRRDEIGARHNCEFTILEWYRRGDDLDAGMALLSDLCQCLLGTPPAGRITFRDAFLRMAGVDPFAGNAVALRDAALALGSATPPALGDDRDAWLDYLMVEHVEPRLGVDGPVILYAYPPSQAALARVSAGPPAVAERFELYVKGFELANGYHELVDAAALRDRHRAQNEARAARGRRTLAVESRLLQAMEHGLPPCTGAALGFDRVVMLATGARHISEVIAFPFDRA